MHLHEVLYAIETEQWFLEGKYQYLIETHDLYIYSLVSSDTKAISISKLGGKPSKIHVLTFKKKVREYK